MIPKIIHYIWLGDIDNMPKLSKKCIDSWKKHLLNYEIIFWDECKIRSTFKENEIEFFNKMVKLKKFAFAADYARCIILDKFGGVYLDTDIEIIRDITPLLSVSDVFLGLEDDNKPNCAVIGATSNNIFLKKLIKFIIQADGLTEIPILAYEALLGISERFCNLNRLTIIDGIAVYPEQFFYPYNPYRRDSLSQLMFSDITEETYAIHHWAKTWKLTIFERIKKRLFKQK